MFSIFPGTYQHFTTVKSSPVAEAIHYRDKIPVILIMLS